MVHAKRSLLRAPFFMPPSLQCPCSVLPQGDIDANKFYVLERGSCDAFIYRESWGEERRVHTYTPGRWEAAE